MGRLNFGGLRWAAFVLSSLTAIGCIAAVADAKTELPKVPTSFETAARRLTVEPRTIVVSQDGNASIWGPSSRGFKGQGHWPNEPGIDWIRWTARKAQAIGSLIEGNCTPSCAQGTFTVYPVRIKLWRPARFHGQQIFTRFSYTFTSNRPSTLPQRVMSTATYIPATTVYGGSPAYWGWAPKF